MANRRSSGLNSLEKGPINSQNVHKHRKSASWGGVGKTVLGWTDIYLLAPWALWWSLGQKQTCADLFWRCCSLAIKSALWGQLVNHWFGNSAIKRQRGNLFEGKYFLERRAGLSLWFVLKNKNNKSNSCFIGGFLCKQRTFWLDERTVQLL